MHTIISLPKKAFPGLKTLLLLLLGVSLFSGCLTFRQTLVFHKDSTCIATYDYTLPREYAPLLREGLRVLGEVDGGTPLSLFLDEAAAKEYFAARGLELRQYRQSQEGPDLQVQIIVLARDVPQAMANGAFGTLRLTKDVLGDWHLSGPLAALPEKLDRAELAHWQKLCQGTSVSLAVTTPTAVIRSNGRNTAFNQVVWEYAWPATAEASSLFQPSPAQVEVTW